MCDFFCFQRVQPENWGHWWHTHCNPHTHPKNLHLANCASSDNPRAALLMCCWTQNIEVEHWLRRRTAQHEIKEKKSYPRRTEQHHPLRNTTSKEMDQWNTAPPENTEDRETHITSNPSFLLRIVEKYVHKRKECRTKRGKQSEDRIQQKLALIMFNNTQLWIYESHTQ